MIRTVTGDGERPAEFVSPGGVDNGAHAHGVGLCRSGQQVFQRAGAGPGIIIQHPGEIGLDGAEGILQTAGAAAGVAQVAFHLEDVKCVCRKSLLCKSACLGQGGVIGASVIDDNDVLRPAGLLRQTAQARERTLAAVEMGEYGANDRHAGYYATGMFVMQGKNGYLRAYVGLLCCFSELWACREVGGVLWSRLPWKLILLT